MPSRQGAFSFSTTSYNQRVPAMAAASSARRKSPLRGRLGTGYDLGVQADTLVATDALLMGL